VAFTVEQACPQCGAPIGLEETDHLLKCPYCHVKSFLFAPDYFHFLLPHKAPGRDIIYAPYLRFKGNAFVCQGQTIHHRIVDITHTGSSIKGLPISLGLRPQAMQMRFVTPDTGGSFLRCSLTAADVLAKAAKHTSGSDEPFHRAYIGEAVSLIYLPLFLHQETVFDAITNRPIVKLSDSEDMFRSGADRSAQWRLTFMSTLCPQCGWNLQGERDSVVLTCNNCDTAWGASEGRFVQVALVVVRGEGENTVYLPFWRITAKAEQIEINSFADFIRVTNQPRVVKEDWEDREMSYWCPAFKIRPGIFLRLLSQLTISQKAFKGDERLPKQGLYPVTLPQGEAVQSLKLTLAGTALTKRNTFPLLPQVKFAVNDTTLVYLPFADAGHDMVQQQMRIGINKKALEYGRYL
jgi:hypothetical protein